MPTGSVPLTPLATVPFSLGQIPAALVQAIGLRAWPATGAGRSSTCARPSKSARSAVLIGAARWAIVAASACVSTVVKSLTGLVPLVHSAALLALTGRSDEPIRRLQMQV